MTPELFRFPANGDARGSLVALESLQQVPFEIRRIYYIFGTLPGVRRGLHAHRDLDQVAICVSGSCRFILDDGRERCEVRLSSPTVGLRIRSMIWREMDDFSPDCVLLVLANRAYDEKDYLRNYAEFSDLVSRQIPRPSEGVS
jgi:dTDP-4-dehydrorhamnose 3,5-epimerase-like enzyme